MGLWWGQPVPGGASAHLSHYCRERHREKRLARFISNLDSHVVEGSGWQVVPEVAEIARHIYSLGTGFIDVGQVRSYVVKVEIVAVSDVKIIPGHGFYGSGKGAIRAGHLNLCKQLGLRQSR